MKNVEPSVYRILSIDGGGIKGVFPASFLATVEDSLNEPIAHYFDLIVGTSTGGIIALALGLGLPASEVLSLYEEIGPSVFNGNPLANLVRSFFVTKYSDTALHKAIKNRFGERTLGESKRRLVIPTTNLDTGEAYLYKTAHDSRFECDYKELATTVAMATSAAPSFFPTHKPKSGLAFVDGGLWANNPTGIAIIEAVAVLGWETKSLRVLSLGCTNPPSNNKQARRTPMGKIYWAPKAIELMMGAQSSEAIGISHVFAGEENVLRINPTMEQDRFRLDGVKELSALKGLGNSEARKALPRLRRDFLTHHAEDFHPFY